MLDEALKTSLNQALTWDRCAYLWKLKYIDKWDKIRKGYKMELGNMGHALLFDWYKTGQDHSTEFANVWLEDVDVLDAEQLTNVATAVSQFKMYMGEFAPEADRGLTTIELEYHFEVKLRTPKGRPFIVEGYIDRMSRDQRGLLWIEDYKWTGRFWSHIEILMDPQLPLYAACLRALGVAVHGCMVTQVNTYPYKQKTRATKTVEDLFQRERFAVEITQTDNVLIEYGRMVDEQIDAIEAVERGETFRRSLRRECKSCDMQEPCLMGLRGMNPVTFMEMSPSYQPKTPRPVDRQDGVALPLQTRTRIPEVSVDGQEITINY